MLTPEVLQSMASSVLCWLATVDAKGAPHVSPKEIFCAHGTDAILVANIASPTTVRNLQSHPAVCVSFVDVFVQKGFKCLGTARLVRPDDPGFSALVAPLEAMTQGQFPIHSVIHIQIEQMAPILAPSYRLRPGTSEASQVEAALKTYGVQRNGTGHA